LGIVFVFEGLLAFILLGHGVVDVLERPVVKSNLELDVLEVIFLVRSGVLVDHWLVVLEATSCVDPTVCVSVHIFFKFNE